MKWGMRGWGKEDENKTEIGMENRSKMGWGMRNEK